MIKLPVQQSIHRFRGGLQHKVQKLVEIKLSRRLFAARIRNQRFSGGISGHKIHLRGIGQSGPAGERGGIPYKKIAAEHGF